uniref:Uncharacterized protein n=1 Tax=viral metagenome TaxID=1070528 RepID=A0A6C0JA54_9ZZZZ
MKCIDCNKIFLPDKEKCNTCYSFLLNVKKMVEYSINKLKTCYSFLLNVKKMVEYSINKLKTCREKEGLSEHMP